MVASLRSVWPLRTPPQGRTAVPTAHIRPSSPSFLKFCRRRGD